MILVGGNDLQELKSVVDVDESFVLGLVEREAVVALVRG